EIRSARSGPAYLLLTDVTDGSPQVPVRVLLDDPRVVDAAVGSHRTAPPAGRGPGRRLRPHGARAWRTDDRLSADRSAPRTWLAPAAAEARVRGRSHGPPAGARSGRRAWRRHIRDRRVARAVRSGFAAAVGRRGPRDDSHPAA